jgi:hypothetical protein
LHVISGRHHVLRLCARGEWGLGKDLLRESKVRDRVEQRFRQLLEAEKHHTATRVVSGMAGDLERQRRLAKPCAPFEQNDIGFAQWAALCPTDGQALVFLPSVGCEKTIEFGIACLYENLYAIIAGWHVTSP